MTSGRGKFDSEIDRAFSERRLGLKAAARRAGGQDEEDIVQDAFLRVIERSRKQNVQTVDKLLSHIVRCFSIDRIRRRATRTSYARNEAGESAVDVAADPERTVIGAQRLKRVLAAIESMPPRRREVFLMHRIEELTYAQIARRCGVSVKAVEKHMALAMRQLSDTDD